MEKKRFRIAITGKNFDQSIEIGKDSCVLGRGKECDIVIDHDLISRKHLKISMLNEEIVIEEMGSTNGTWINNTKMDKGKKIPYSIESKVQLGGVTGLILKVENLIAQNNILKIKSNDIDKTMVHDIPLMKVANGGVEILNDSSPRIKLVSEDHTTKKSLDFPTKKSNDKKNLDGQLKKLVLQESEKIREKSLKEANLIKEKALEEEKLIQLKAQQAAKEIIENSKEEAARKRSEAEHSLLSLKEQIKLSENEADMITKNHKHTINLLEEKIAALRQAEAGHNQKMKQLDDEYQSTKERIRNENLLLEELKQQSHTVKKSADLKLEEVLLQERRSKAKIETELDEAQAQTAKIFVEAEKVQAIKDSIITELAQLNSDKTRIEKEINETQIKHSKLEYEYEKFSMSYQALVSQNEDAKNSYQEVLNQIKDQQDTLVKAQLHFDEKERTFNLKIIQAESHAQEIIENAQNEAKKITIDSQVKLQKLQEQNAKAIKELEIQKIKIAEDLEFEKKSKMKDLQHEIEMLKSTHTQELEKLEIKKTSLFNEIKWQESNAKATCEKLVAQAKAETQELKEQTLKNVELLKNSAKNDVQIIKDRTQKEIQSSKENAQTEIENLKKEAHLEIATIKTNLAAEMSRFKVNSEEELAKSKLELALELNKVKSEAEALEELKKNLQVSIERTDNLMNDNHLQAQQKIQDMLAEAQNQVTEIESAGRDQRSKEQVMLNELRQVEIEKIEELKVKFEEYKIASKNEMAGSIGLAVQEFLAIEMIKSRNLILDEKLIKKLSERSKKIVTDVALGRLQASSKGISELFKVKKIDYVGIFKIIAALIFVGGTLYLAKTYPVETRGIIEQITEFFKKQDLTLPF